VKLIKADKEHFSFHIQPREKQIFFQVLGLYPLVPIAHQRLSKSGEHPEAQQMLDEALAAQRRENQAQVQQLTKAVFHEQEDGFRFSLNPSQMEWVLQVLNDVRVGSWLLLGSPNGKEDIYKSLNETTAPHFWAMEMASAFQYNLLTAVEGGEQSVPPTDA
jgi:hypothetical protein